MLLGRNYIGLERDEEWVEKARARLASAEELVRLDGGIRDEDCLALCRPAKRK